jgi:hypothetical protein
LFEVNPAGRWLYDWESGVTRAQRDTMHVFEVFALRATSSCSVGIYSNRREVAEYEVVASVRSTPFTLLSFRRRGGKINSSVLSSLVALSEDTDSCVLSSPAPIGLDSKTIDQAHADNPLTMIPSSIEFSFTPTRRIRTMLQDLATIYIFAWQISCLSLSDFMVLDGQDVSTRLTVAKVVKEFSDTASKILMSRRHKVTTIVLPLATWLLWGSSAMLPLQDALAQAVDMLTDQRALYLSYFSWIEIAHNHLDTYLMQLAAGS